MLNVRKLRSCSLEESEDVMRNILFEKRWSGKFGTDYCNVVHFGTQSHFVLVVPTSKEIDVDK